MLADFHIFINVIALLQGLILAILLMAKNNKGRSSFFLGLFVFFFSLNLITFISHSLIQKGLEAWWLPFPFDFSGLLFPLFLIYTYKVSVFAHRRPPYWILIPVLITIVFQIYRFFFLPNFSYTIFDIPYQVFFTSYVSVVYSWFIGIWNLKILCNHKKIVGNTYSQVVEKELQWVRYYLFAGLSTVAIMTVLFLVDETNVYYKTLYSIFNLVAIYWVAIHGIKQHNVIVNTNDGNNEQKIRLRRSKLKVGIDLRMLDLIQKIDTYLTSTQAYTHSNLTIIDIADNLKTHPKRISTAINLIKKKNFNLYINQFRISKAIKLLKGDEPNRYSMEGIGQEVGFKSKSAFYAAFKKETGTTPIKYKSKNSESM